MESKKLLLLKKLVGLPHFNRVISAITTKYVVELCLDEVMADKSLITKEIVDKYYDMFQRELNPQALIDLTKSLELAQYTYDPKIEEIHQIQQPTLILWGDQDKLLPSKNGEAFAENIPNSDLVIFENVGHIPMEEIPERSLEVVKSFIAR